jgi:HEAT repeat protein
MTYARILLAALVLSAGSLMAAAGEFETPDGMPLAIYQKIKGHFDALYGAKSSLLPGIEATPKEEVEKALRKDAADNKEVLIKALASKAVIHRELACRALEYCGDNKAAVSALGKALVDDKEDSVRRAAAATLAKLPDAASVEPLIKALQDKNDSVRGLAATALGNIKDSRASLALLNTINNDAKSIVRMQAANALGKIKDASTFEPLKKSLEGEKDEMVRLAITGAMRNLMPEDKEKQGPTAEEASGELASLAKEMKEVEEKLRNDRHDQAVQVQGGDIEKKLSQLIEKLAAASSSSSSGSQGEKNGQKQQQQSGGQQNNGKSGGSPLNDSKLGGAVPPGAANAAQVAGKQDGWAKLPPAQRDEILQKMGEDLPERWRQRLKAYYYSLNVEEVKAMK